MFNLLFKSWLVGLLSAGLFVLPLSRIWGASQTEGVINEIGMRLFVFVANIPLAMWLTFTVGAVVSLPVVLVLAACGWAFKDQMARHPVAFAVSGGLLMLVVSAIGAVIVGEHQWADSLAPMAQFQKLLFSWITAAFAVPTGLATYFFAKRVTKTTRIPPAYGAR